MERLTYTDKDGGVCCPWERNSVNGSYDIWDEEGLIKQLNRLAAYEDTGLSPEEIKEHEAAYIEILSRTYGPLHQKIDQWLKAEEAGRLVVLPCGTDAELSRDGHVFKADHWNHILTAFRDAPENKSGMQVAVFSIEKAEAALVGKGGDA